MKKLMKRVISGILAGVIVMTSSVTAFAESNMIKSNIVEITGLNPVGKTNINTSIYGHDLEDNLINNEPIITDFAISDTNVSISGFVNHSDKNSSFELLGTAYKTYDNNIFCQMTDISAKYDVIFTCLEKKQTYNDYVLYRNVNNYSNEMGEYGLKIYLMEKGTRNISLIEDLNVTINDLSTILSECEETDYSNLNWFTVCFEPTPENNIMQRNVTSKNYEFIDTETYWFGNVSAKMGIRLTSTVDTPTSLDEFAAKLEFNWVVKASNPAYNNPYRAADYYRVENVRAEGLIGQGYYLQQAKWNGSGATTMSSNLTLDLYLSYEPINGVATITYSNTPKTFKKDNWINLIDSNCDKINKMPRKAKTTYDSLILSTPSHYADFVVNPELSEYATSPFNYYNTTWTFDIYKRVNPLKYTAYKTNQTLSVGAYF